MMKMMFSEHIPVTGDPLALLLLWLCLEQGCCGSKVKPS